MSPVLACLHGQACPLSQAWMLCVDGMFFIQDRKWISISDQIIDVLIMLICPTLHAL